MADRRAIIVADLAYGDAGKGTIVDWLARTRSVSAVVRHNGGGQAAHNVHTDDGRHHTFAHFGSGSFVPGVRTHLSRFMLVDPLALTREALALEANGCGDVRARLSVDEDARIVTPYHVGANRAREALRGEARHGSCGMGIGETMADALAHPDDTILARHLRSPEELTRRLARVAERKREEFRDRLDELAADPLTEDAAHLFGDAAAPTMLAEALWRTGNRFRIVPGSYLRTLGALGDLVFEGAQGVLLDEWHGFSPYTTWSTPGFQNAEALLAEIGYAEPRTKLGVLRAYFTRHGPGPFVTEDAQLTRMLPDTHNGTGDWQGRFRVGWFDLIAARYALAVAGGADALAVTNLDRFASIRGRRVATAYDLPHDALAALPADAYDGGPLGPGALRVSALRVNPVREDLARQERLSMMLMRAVPRYAHAPLRESAYLSLIEAGLSVPVVLTSHGTTASSKRLRVPLANVA